MKLNQKKINDFLNKHIIVGITYLDHNGDLIEEIQLHGDIVKINESEGIVIQMNNSNTIYSLPPDLSSIKKAPIGEYQFRTTGEIVVNPDFMTSWTIEKPDPNKIAINE